MLSVLTAGSLQAGGFGGPPPFTNGSPLPEGTDGVYQASARGKNLSGIISFTHSGGLQEPGGRWTIFHQGEVFTGSTDTAIMDGKISGVLATAFTTPVTREDSITTPTYESKTTIEPAAIATGPAGYFNASLDNGSPTGAFKGKGELTSVAKVTKTTTTDKGSPNEQTTETVETQLLKAKFKVKGVRAHQP